jgi:hypothetical protein
VPVHEGGGLVDVEALVDELILEELGDDEGAIKFVIICSSIS